MLVNQVNFCLGVSSLRLQEVILYYLSVSFSIVVLHIMLCFWTTYFIMFASVVNENS